jgi:hypothetical protein
VNSARTDPQPRGHHQSGADRVEPRQRPTGERLEHHGIQVKVRARIHPTGWERVELICEAMNEQILRRVVTVDASVYLVQCVSGARKVHEFKRDPKSELRYYSLNGLVAVRKTSA